MKMEKINIEDDNKAYATRMEFKEFFSSTVMSKLTDQMLNNKETGLTLMDNGYATRHPVSLFLLNSISASIVNRNKYYKFFFRKNIYNFCATSVRPHHYMLFLKLSNGKLIGVDVPVGDKKDAKNLMVILCSALTELYVRYTIYKDETVVISSF
jgi:hypothetical protein